MPTETQKNFRKQMKEAQKEIKNNKNENDGFYSYVKKDYINSYYKKSKKRKKVITTISITSLILILWNSYAIYTWINPIFHSVTGKSIPTVGRIIDFKGENHRKVGEYLRSIDFEEEKIKKIFNYRSNGFNTDFQNKVDKQEYLKKIEEYSIEIINAISRIEKLKPPSSMLQFHNITLNKNNTCYRIFVLTLRLDNINKVEEMNEFIIENNELINQYNKLNNEAINEMINVFNEIDMKYQVSDGKIEYWWNE